ncbi:uncharacterized protein ACHE_10459A [Aspergillus chevalieri]|uniref:Uncharacterized protein n=1 Tax=Aspergillus chevalieri TaxID=182096 RepID=A0A7R7ZJI2_ASPCH|nr:uncharacterized protein ACHE_10459A [Aspergillus chevalieri]BCR83057.1 hypothetical protein ACHE_10459A [Aspergillus chevalieri]
MVQAAGSGSILLFIPDKPAQYSAAPAVSATKYRNLTPKHAHVVIGMVREARQLPCSLFKDEDLFNSFLFHRPPQIMYRLELLTDDEIRQEPIDSDQLFTISKPLKTK